MALSKRQQKAMFARMRYGDLGAYGVGLQHGPSRGEWDKRLSAKPPGKRISEAGGTYYEYRRNRSDVDKGI